MHPDFLALELAFLLTFLHASIIYRQFHFLSLVSPQKNENVNSSVTTHKYVVRDVSNELMMCSKRAKKSTSRSTWMHV